jgi:predicted AlkP superfamily pyrophosphatase or phosphodiesterase
MTNLLALMQTSAYTLKAQTIMPSVTLPSHTSMLTGLCPAKHGVNWNDYIPENGYAKGPSLFDVAHAAGFQTDMVVGKQKLVQVTDPASVDSFTFINDRDVVIAQKLLENFPDNFGVLFVHFPVPDDMGHNYGWMSWQYLDVLRQADKALASILQTLDDKGLRAETLVIITADHGGHDMGHGTNLPVDMTIPWLVNGPGVVPGELTIPVNTTDTAATAAWALGLTIPSNWDGIPVYEAFGQTSPARPDPRCP